MGKLAEFDLGGWVSRVFVGCCVLLFFCIFWGGPQAPNPQTPDPQPPPNFSGFPAVGHVDARGVGDPQARAGRQKVRPGLQLLGAPVGLDPSNWFALAQQQLIDILVYIYIYIYMYVYTYVYICHTHIYIYTHICLLICVCV